MSWTETSPGHWERPLDGLESWFVLMRNNTISLCEGREHLKITSRIQLKVSPSASFQEALEHAWKQLRYEQPGLACLVDGFQKVYEVPDEKSLEAWVAETLIESSASSAEELAPDLVLSVPRARLYWLPKSRELILNVPHHQIDGLGIIRLWHSLLSAVVSPMLDLHFGGETRNLAPTAAVALGNSPEATAEETERVTAVFNQWAKYVPGIGPKSKLGEAASGQCLSTETQFSPESTAGVMSACKKQGLSVTSAVHAAFIGALEKHADPSTNVSRYANMGLFDLRRYLPQPYNTSAYAVAVYFSYFPFISPLPTSFRNSAIALNKYYKTTIPSNPDFLALDGKYKKVLFEAFTSPEIQSKPLSKDAMISSLGIVENHLHRSYASDKVNIQIENFDMQLDIVMGMSTLTIYTFNDTLRIIYNYNDGFQDKEDIDALLESLAEILLRELQIG